MHNSQEAVKQIRDWSLWIVSLTTAAVAATWIAASSDPGVNPHDSQHCAHVGLGWFSILTGFEIGLAAPATLALCLSIGKAAHLQLGVVEATQKVPTKAEQEFEDVFDFKTLGGSGDDLADLLTAQFRYFLAGLCCLALVGFTAMVRRAFF
jgi:hypothetical protein